MKKSSHTHECFANVVDPEPSHRSYVKTVLQRMWILNRRSDHIGLEKKSVEFIMSMLVLLARDITGDYFVL